MKPSKYRMSPAEKMLKIKKQRYSFSEFPMNKTKLINKIKKTIPYNKPENKIDNTPISSPAIR